MSSPRAKTIILEIRAGAGGNEAGLFVADLFRMYQRYAAKKGWNVSPLGVNEGGMGNIKSIAAEIRGDDAYRLLKTGARRTPCTTCTPNRIIRP